MSCNIQLYDEDIFSRETLINYGRIAEFLDHASRAPALLLHLHTAVIACHPHKHSLMLSHATLQEV